MRKRLLSIILSLNLIFNYSFCGIAVVAEDGENPVSEVTDKVPENEGENIQKESETKQQSVIALRVSLNEHFPCSIYYGQSVPNFNEKENDIPKYYSVATKDGSEIPEGILKKIYQEIKVGIEAETESSLEIGKYNVIVSLPEIADEAGTIYRIENTNFPDSFTVNAYEIDPLRVSLVPYIKEDGQINRQYVRSSDNKFRISLDKTDDFSESGISLSELQKNGNQYYVQNMDENSEEYLAVSNALLYNDEVKISISAFAEITNENFDVSSPYHNQPLNFNVTGEITGYSEDDAREIIEKYLLIKSSRNVAIAWNIENVTFVKCENGVQFCVPCTFPVKDEECLSVEVSGRFTIESFEKQSLKFKYQNEDIETVILDRTKLSVKKTKADGKKVTVTITKNSYGSSVASIQYAIEGMYLDEKTQTWKKSEDNRIAYAPYDFEVSEPSACFNERMNLWIDFKNVEKMDEYILYLKITDYAGNVTEWKSNDEENTKIKIDDNPPEIDVTPAKIIVDDKWNYVYLKENDEIKITIKEEENDIKSIRITPKEEASDIASMDTAPEDEAHDADAINIILKDNTPFVNYLIEDNEKGKIITIPVSELQEEEYHLIIEATDKLENKAEKEIHFHVDKENPKVSISDSGNQTWEKLTLNIRDEISGISKVEYSYDEGENKEWFDITNQLEWEEQNKNGTFAIKANGNQGVFVKVTDNAGNQNYNQNESFSFPVDENPPEITSVKLYYDASETGSSDWQEIDEENFHSYKYGNFTNKRIQIRITADDNQEGIVSGLRSVSVCNKPCDCQKVQVECCDENGEVIKDEEGNIQYEEKIEYYYSIFENGDFDLYIEVTDNAGNGENEKKSLPSLKEDKNIVTNYVILHDKMTIDTKRPVGAYEKPEFVSFGETNWYGTAQKDGSIIIHANDNESGIRSIIVCDKGKPLVDYQWEKEDVDTNDNYYVDISIPISEFDENEEEHSLTVRIIDNAGNSETSMGFWENESPSVKSLDFSTDFTAPKGNINLASQSVVKIGDENWFDWSDDIEFRFDIEDNHPNKVEWKVRTTDEKNGTLNYENSSLSVSLTTNESGAELNENGEHSYVITGTFYDQAGNNFQAPVLELHKDLKAPEIEKVSISKRETALEQVLRILTFGIYSNDSVALEVLTSESSGDSGLGETSVELFINGMTFLTDTTDTTDVTDDTNSTENATDTTENPTDTTNTTDATEVTNPTETPTDTTEYSENENHWFMKLKNSKEDKYEEDNEEKTKYIYQYEYIFPEENSELYEKLVNQAICGEISIRITDLYQLNGEEQNVKHLNGKHTTSEFGEIFANGEEVKGDKTTNSTFFMIEKIAPVLQVSPLPVSDGQKREDGEIWYNQDHTIDIYAQDIHSGICNVDVIVNDVMIMSKDPNDSVFDFLKEEVSSKKESPVTEKLHYQLSTDRIISYLATSGKTPENSHYVVKVIAEDNAGNKAEVIKDFYVDKTAPEVNSIDFSVLSADNDADASQFIEILEYGYYFKTKLLATVNISDAAPSSGLHRIEYRLVSYQNMEQTGEVIGAAPITDGTAEFIIPENFKGQIFVKALDYVENVSKEVTPQSFVVDTPEKHESEKHIHITGLDDSSYSDEKQNKLYDRTMTVNVTITDTMSGIRDFTYLLTSEKDTKEEVTVTISNTDNSIGQELGDGWTITAMDENLVTEVARTYSFSSDDNDIQLSFKMTDRANNGSEASSDMFSIDLTDPIIDVVFDSPAGKDEYYQDKRTAVITITERNFNPSDVIATITNTNSMGNVPSVNFVNNSNTEHVAVVEFYEGDYTFSIEGTDRCEHPATVRYSGGNENMFYVDGKDPAITSDNFSEFKDAISLLVEQENGNSDQKNVKVMKFTINEHNFNPENVHFTVNKEEKTLVWDDANEGDEHTATYSFEEDGYYEVNIAIDDLSGRHMEKNVANFEIDGTRPKLVSPHNLDVLSYLDREAETAEPIVFEDQNISKISYSVVSYRMIENTENPNSDEWEVEVSEKEVSEISFNPDIFEKGKINYILDSELFSEDGIYEVKCVAYDKVGNASEETTHTFIVQREKDFLVYIPESNSEKGTGLYQFNERGIRSAAFEDIKIIAYVAEGKQVDVEVADNSVDEDYLLRRELTGSELGKGSPKEEKEKINKINSQEITLEKGYFTDNYGEDDVDADLILNAVVETAEITLGHIYIDNVKPTGNYEKRIQNLKDYECLDKEIPDVKVEGVSPDIDLSRSEIQIVNVVHRGIFRKERVEKVLKYSDIPDDNSFSYDKENNAIMFKLAKEENEIRPTLVDKAGNINNLSTKNVYLGELFKRYWYLFFIGGMLFLSILVIWVRKKKVSK